MIGKLLAQGVKLATLFAAMAPFMAMSFLLGGIDFVTILLSLVVLFMWSLWASAAFLFLSCLLKSRAMSGLIFGVGGIVLFVGYGMSRVLFFAATRGVGGVGGVSVFGGGVGGWPGQGLVIMATYCLATMINLVLLAENRLSLPTDNRVTPLRIGFLVQFLLIAGWTLAFFSAAPPAAGAISALGVFGGLHLAVVATFAVTESLVVSRRVRLQMTPASRWGWLLAIVRPGGGRGALYVLVQMVLLLLVAWRMDPDPANLRWFLALCGYICFFTGVPTIVFRSAKPAGAASVQLRVAALLLLPLSMLLPDIVYYAVKQPEVLDLSFGARHLINPIRTLANWSFIESWHSYEFPFFLPFFMGAIGLLSYLALILLGARVTAQPAPDSDASEEAAGEPGSAKALY